MDELLLEKISSPEVQAFIREHEHDDEREIVLKKNALVGVPSKILAEQIAGRKKAKEKLPSFYTAPVVYPPSLNLEQSSSEHTAIFKSEILKNLSPSSKILVDLTGGFGVDAYFFSKGFEHVIYTEPDEQLLKLVSHNHAVLNVTNIRYKNLTAETLLQHGEKADIFYVDPSRRDKGRKVFTFQDSEPDIVTLQEQIFELSGYLLIKSAPLLDIKRGLEELRFVKDVYVVAVRNEVKELLFFSEKHFNDQPKIHTVNLRSSGERQAFSFYFSEEDRSTANFSEPLRYLYEPNAAILKAGAFKLIGNYFQLAKLHPSTHMYTANLIHEDFPGRIFQVDGLTKPDKASIAKFFPEGKANVTTRNYPLSVAELRKKVGLKEGGDKFLIGFASLKAKNLAVASRIK